MLWQSSSALLALEALLTNAFVGAAAVPAMAHDNGYMVDATATAVPPPVILKPVPHHGLSLQDPPSMELLRSDSFFWRHEDRVANLTVVAADNYRLLNAHRFSAAVRSVDCTASDSASATAITIAFHDADGLSSARAAWSWIEDGLPEDTNRSIVYVVDEGACGGEHGRQPYYVGSVGYDAGSHSAVLATRAAEWADFSADASVRLRRDDDDDDDDEGAARARRDVPEELALDMGYSFRGTSFTASTGGVRATVECVDCATLGGFDSDMMLNREEGFASLLLLTTHGFGARFAFSFDVSGSLSHPFAKTWDIASVPLAGAAIPKVLALAPVVNVQAELGLNRVSGAFKAEVGAMLKFPDEPAILLKHHLGTEPSGPLTPRLTIIGPRIDANVSVNLYAAPVVSLSIEGTFLGEGIVAGVALTAPILNAEIGVAASSGGGVCPGTGGDARLGVSYRLSVGADLSCFAGLKGAQLGPIGLPLLSVDRTVDNGCVAIA